jgi:hypothetical protein
MPWASDAFQKIPGFAALDGNLPERLSYVPRLYRNHILHMVVDVAKVSPVPNKTSPDLDKHNPLHGDVVHQEAGGNL